ncbi:hypothetical protein SAMN05216548_101470 [Faunimonas pinastri]|uniref:Uncharacterized protein n=1 Tax=Faunimonas pinastri TaxID=1855383 RepID=A0A1H9AN06_9HYPH|nr:hypothetical protein [Faunimonas pinastri]SEP77931.1 hypothetical protein SAMN05216548_101470 [Faunimonas pinastri]
MYLVQILLPLRDNHGKPLPHELYGTVRHEMSERFGGLTAFTRAPAEGLWHGSDRSYRDDIVTLEVMVEELDRSWWAEYRESLEQRFRQEEVVIRAQPIELL